MTKLTFYLSPAPFSAADVAAMVLLPVKILFDSPSTWVMMAATTTDAQHASLIVAVPQPSGWDGSIAMAKALLRSADFTHLWWLFDHFIAVQDADRADRLRTL